MGRTLSTTNDLIRKEMNAFANFKRALRQDDQKLLEQLFVYVQQHTAAISLIDHALPLESIMMAMMLEQQREITKQQNRIAELEEVVKCLISES